MRITNPVDSTINPEYFSADKNLLRIAQAAASSVQLQDLAAPHGTRLPRITIGLVVTGDQFIGSDSKKQELQDLYKADACEMEGAAVAQVCHEFGIPWLVVRSLSDLADDAADEDAYI